MIKIGTTQAVYCKKYGFEEGLERMRSHGFEGLDYQEFVETDTPLFEKSSHEWEQYLGNQRKMTQKAGIIIHQTHGPWRCPPKDSTVEEREERFEKMSRSIEGTAILGCDRMVIHPIMPHGMNNAGYEQEDYEMNLEFMTRLSCVGQKNGVTICYENMPMPNLSLGSVPDVFHFAKDIDSKYFKVCLDTGHSTMFEMGAGDAVRMLGREYLHAMHVHDSDGVRDRHWSPFTGKIDWDDFGKALYEIGFDGVLSLEVKVSGDLADCLREKEELALYQKACYIAKLASCGR